MPRFLKWDFDEDTITEYRRLGECNNCGACCIDINRYRTLGRKTLGYGQMGDKVQPEGIWAEWWEGNNRRFISLPRLTGEHRICDELKDKRCKVHGLKSASRHTLCLAWPIIPEHLTLYPECSYTFEEIAVYRIGQLIRKHMEKQCLAG